MDNLIEALNIFKMYNDADSYVSKYPFHCEHDVLYVRVDNGVSEEHIERLEQLGFSVDDDHDDSSNTCFKSFHYGSN